MNVTITKNGGFKKKKVIRYFTQSPNPTFPSPEEYDEFYNNQQQPGLNDLGINSPIIIGIVIIFFVNN